MYSRSYPLDRGAGTPVPSGYAGCAFEDEKNSEKLDTPPGVHSYDEENESLCDTSPCSAKAEECEKPPSKSFFSGILSSLFGTGYSGGFNLRFPRIGTEEILIIATALFLLFSKEGDTECAVLLLLLLLIN